MRITVLLASCCLAGTLAGCLKPRRGPPEFLFGPGAVRGSGSVYVDAATTLAAGAGAAVANREAYDICYASCQRGTACDPATGLCVRLPCGGACPADRRCKLVEGRETCVLEAPDRGVVPPLAEPGAGDPGPGGPAGEVDGGAELRREGDEPASGGQESRR
ncbi:hypothetical protein WMF37_24550 [Sorangium sp. So ce291]|uniref:hypothetical protein n=1 Tax=Sorangium sp. So ce291 TaxID=3133294 RepID=UPI003F603672